MGTDCPALFLMVTFAKRTGPENVTLKFAGDAATDAPFAIELLVIDAWDKALVDVSTMKLAAIVAIVLRVMSLVPYTCSVAAMRG
jgi:hypothetical protein